MITFYGHTYMYPTPNDGLCEIGVTNGLGDGWIVAWSRLAGSATKRVKTSNLPASADPLELQIRLDAWAQERSLRRVIPGGPIVSRRAGMPTLAESPTCRNCRWWRSVVTINPDPMGICDLRPLWRSPTDPQCETFEQRNP